MGCTQAKRTSRRNDLRGAPLHVPRDHAPRAACRDGHGSASREQRRRALSRIAAALGRSVVKPAQVCQHDGTIRR